MKRKGLIVFLLFLLVALGVTGWKSYNVYQHAKIYLPNKCTINGVDCSGLTIGDAKNKLTENWNGKTYVVKQGGNTIGKISGLDFTYEIDDQIKGIADLGFFKTVYRAFLNKPVDEKISMKAAAVTQGVKKQINGFKFLDKKGKVPTKNAYVDLSNRDFKIVREVYGDFIDKNRFTKKVVSDVADGAFELQYQPKNFYKLPTIKAGDKKLADYKEWCKENLSQVITYAFRDGDYTVTPKQLNSVLRFDDKNQKSVDDKALDKLVYSFAVNHNTAYGSRSFKTHNGNTITVNGGDYGWIIDKKKEKKRLKEALLAGDDEKYDPFYLQTPYYTGKGSDIGNSYVEIDLGSQSMYMYKNGKLIISSNVVSGKVTDGHATPSGTYMLDYKQRNTVLRGYNTDGTKYESPVSYWMPFNGGIGMHDAPWRNAFGGNIYYSNGSHGCVNLPVGVAATVFGQIDEGYPIVVHY